ncbi:metal-dependent phosphohydrolase [Dissulfurispira thermophila]|uniref:Metal-dependent phosphohydrolase n=2 Tax=root TaxID=1 RepID=A0A7G1H107_9BACT|nr:HDOD domain-containing protein [Dissulfurispira thermophila]BCB96434.1 metal-dependent phosphohydrolase [Dissulfurispira thermophila]
MKEDALEKIILETVDIPSLPTVAMKVLQLMQSDYSSINELEKIISHDQAFSTRLLRIANSPYYGRGRSIDTVSTAIVLIGFNTMKNLVVAASLKDIHRKFGLFEQKLWEHSLGVSIAASIIAMETKLVQSEEALVAGLIHDVGKTVLNNSLPERYAVIVERVYEEGLPFIEVENDMLGFNHCNVGGLIARKWKLPKNLEVVMEYHHAETFPSFEDSNFETFCEIIKIADAVCLNMGIGLRRPVNISNIELDRIGISEEKFSELQEKIKKAYTEQKAKLLE